jgi:hypothetical protein
MMTVVCAWCKADLGFREGPAGEVSHGICKPCQERQLAMVRRPFSVMVGALVFVLLLLAYGVAGESDRRDAEMYAQLQQELALNRSWAVTQ